MLSEGIWIPDTDSIAASVDILEHIVMQIKDAKLLPDDFELTDARES
jgi:hypothetical protein